MKQKLFIAILIAGLSYFKIVFAADDTVAMLDVTCPQQIPTCTVIAGFNFLTGKPDTECKETDSVCTNKDGSLCTVGAILTNGQFQNANINVAKLQSCYYTFNNGQQIVQDHGVYIPHFTNAILPWLKDASGTASLLGKWIVHPQTNNQYSADCYSVTATDCPTVAFFNG